MRAVDWRVASPTTNAHVIWLNRQKGIEMKIILRKLDGDEEIDTTHLLGVEFVFGERESLSLSADESHLEVHSPNGRSIVVEPRAANMVYIREAI